MLRIQRAFGGQFRRPAGLLGRIVAAMMRRSNAPLNFWIAELLHVGPRDRILEVGFGPGVALGALLAHASDGFVAGVDTSGLMVEQARSRHARAIAAGQLEIRQGDAGSLPYDDATFDKACGTHVIYFWPDPVATVHELRRVLRPGGTLALGYHERERIPPRNAATLIQAGARLLGLVRLSRSSALRGSTTSMSKRRWGQMAPGVSACWRSAESARADCRVGQLERRRERAGKIALHDPTKIACRI